MKHFLCHRRGLPDVTIGFFGGIGGCDGAAPSALAAAGSGLRISCSRFRRFSLRLGCPGFGFRRFSLRLRCSWLRLHCLWLRLPRLAALGSLLLASAWLPGFGLRRLPRWVRCLPLRFRCFSLRLPPLAALSLLLLASTWLLPVSTSAACRVEFAASRAGFVASRFGLAARGFDFRRFSLRLRRLPPPLPASRKLTGRADHTHTSFTSKH